MKYFVLLAGYGEMPDRHQLTPDEQQAGMAEHEAFDAAPKPVSGRSWHVEQAGSTWPGRRMTKRWPGVPTTSSSVTSPNNWRQYQRM